MGRFENFTPPKIGSELTSSEITIVEELVALANSSSGQFIRKESGSLVNSTLSETIALSGLSDVIITSAVWGDLLYNNGTNWVNLAPGIVGQLLQTNGVGATLSWVSPASGVGTVTSVSVVTANGVSGTVATSTTAPAITLTLGAITPSAVQVSGLTASEILGTDASKNLVSLAVATYPSLTELSYVKGLSSAVQTQINAKAATLAGTINEISYFNSASTIASLAVATYPSLTELTYVKGVTSAIQTQLNAKAATLAGTINEIAYFNSASTIASLAVATYPSLTELTYVKGVTSAIQTQFTGKAAVDQTMYIGTTAITINRASAALTLAGITLTTPDIGTPSSGTLTSCSGLPLTGLVSDTTTALGIGSINLGHATDTTIARSGAGDITIEGNIVYRAGGTDVPVADGGTGVSSLTAYAVLCGGTTSTGAIQSIASVGTSGQVLTSNGAGALPTFQAAGGATPSMMVATSFETAARFSTTVDGGSATFNNPQADIDTTGVATRSAKISWQPVNFQKISLYDGSPTFSVMIASNGLTAASGGGSSFFGIGTPTVDGSGHTYTVAHIGFKILKAGGVVSVYGTQANGTETATAALTTIVDNDVVDLIFKVNGSTSVDYYVRKNGGALSSATNLATNQPTGVQSVMSFSVSNDASAYQFKFQIGSASYSR